MPPSASEISSRDTLNSLPAAEERRRTGRYVAGGTALAVTLLAIHHVLLRGASTVAGVCIPAIIMVSYIIWVLYSFRRDRRKARRLASAMQLTEVINVDGRAGNLTTSNLTGPRANPQRDAANPTSEQTPNSCENPLFSTKDELPSH